MTLHVYRSEIRDSTINELLEKIDKRNINKYISDRIIKGEGLRECVDSV